MISLGVIASQANTLRRAAPGVAEKVAQAAATATLSFGSLIVPERKTAQGVLVKSTSMLWQQIVDELGTDWSRAYQLSPERWEELVAGAFKRSGYDEVTVTPRSGDHGRDVIAIKNGVGCVKVIGSVKANKPGRLVDYDDIRALLGVLSGEHNASKGILTTTSAFPPKVESDPFIGPFLPTRLELMDGDRLRKWLASLK